MPDPIHALLLMSLEGVLLLTLSLFGSTLMPTLANGVVVFTLLGLAWLAGIIEFVGRLLQNAPDSTGGDAMLNIGTAVSLLLPSDALWRGASYYLESPSLLAVMGAAARAAFRFSRRARPRRRWWSGRWATSRSCWAARCSPFDGATLMSAQQAAVHKPVDNCLLGCG